MDSPHQAGKGLAPSGGNSPDKRRPSANPQTCRAFAGGRYMSYRVLRGKGKPFPYRGIYANSPKVVESGRCCCRRAGSARSTIECMRIRRRLNQPIAVCCGGCRGRHPLHRGAREFAVGGINFLATLLDTMRDRKKPHSPAARCAVGAVRSVCLLDFGAWQISRWSPRRYWSPRHSPPGSPGPRPCPGA